MTGHRPWTCFLWEKDIQWGRQGSLLAWYSKRRHTDMLKKKTVDDINVKGKRVLVRCDFNVPLKDGKITDENRLVAALPTIKKLIADGGRVILCSHLGKPKGVADPKLSLAPVAARLSELLGQEVKFAADDNVVGPNAKAAVEAMKDGDVILLQNTRYRAEETKNGEEFCFWYCSQSPLLQCRCHEVYQG